VTTFESVEARGVMDLLNDAEPIVDLIERFADRDGERIVKGTEA